MSLDEKKKEQFLKKRDKMRERHKRVQELDDSPVTDEPKEPQTISLESLQEQLQTLKHEINIETIQNKLRAHELFFKELGEDKDLLFDIIRLYKQKRELKAKK
jgi:hypothetical protein